MYFIRGMHIVPVRPNHNNSKSANLTLRSGRTVLVVYLFFGQRQSLTALKYYTSVSPPRMWFENNKTTTENY